MYLANNPGFDCKSEVWTSQILMGIMLYLIIFMSIKTTVKRSLTLFFTSHFYIQFYLHLLPNNSQEMNICLYSWGADIDLFKSLSEGWALFVCLFPLNMSCSCASKTSAALKEFRFLDILLKISPPKECTSVFTVFSWRLSFKQTFTGNYVRCLLKKR